MGDGDSQERERSLEGSGLLRHQRSPTSRPAPPFFRAEESEARSRRLFIQEDTLRPSQVTAGQGKGQPGVSPLDASAGPTPDLKPLQCCHQASESRPQMALMGE